MGKVGTEDTLQKILGVVGQIAKSQVDFTNLDEIHKIVQSGVAPEVFNIGDQIPLKYTATNGTQYEMPLDIVDFEDVELEGGLIVPGMVVQSHYATVESIQFDAPEPDRPAAEDYSGQIAQYGWERYATSAVRQWLNSDKEKGTWWTEQNDYDVAPSQHGTYNGFMRGLPDEFLSIIKPVKVETARDYRYPSGASGTYVYDTTYDMFFLPSKEQEYTVADEPNHREGKAWQYWIDRLTPEALANGEPVPQATYASADVTHALKSHIRYAMDNHASAQVCRLRSAPRYSAGSVWYVYTTGHVYRSNASNSTRFAPACVIC